MKMTEEQQKVWDEACEMEKAHQGNPRVMLAVIQIRQRILAEMGAVPHPGEWINP